MNFLKKSFWVLGTDTGIGKTYVTSLLSLYCQSQNRSFSLTKPVASGTYELMGDEVNEDVESLKAIVMNHQKEEEISPWIFKAACAPWSAAQAEGRSLSAAEIAQHVVGLEKKFGMVIAESVGGLAVPLNEEEVFLDAVQKTGLPAVLVVGLKLGCINHALLSLESLKRRNIEVKALFLNHFESGVDEGVISSSRNEISSRFKEIIELPYVSSYPMAMAELDKSGAFS